jgi:excisionase family DNA binding protein
VSDAGKVYSLAQVQKILNLGRLSVIRYIRTGKIKAFRLGKAYRIKEEELNRYMERNTVEKDK